MNIKIIQVSCVSHSLYSEQLDKTLEWAFTHDWYAYTAFNLKKNHPELDIECWTPERRYNSYKEFLQEGVRFRIFPGTFFVRHGMEISIAMLNELKKEVERCKSNNIKLILHFHEYHSWQVYLILLSLKKDKNIKVFAQHHGGRSPFKNLQKYKRLILFFPAIAMMQFFENLLFKKFDMIYSLSDEETEYLKNIAPKTNIKFSTMGVEDKYFKTLDKKKARKELGLDQNKKYGIYIGRIKSTKGIKELLDGIKETDVNLLMVGGGEDLQIFKEYSMKNNISNVNFLGPIYEDKKLVYISPSDFLILPSYTEGAPVVIMEALARNIPIIATDVGGIKNMLEDGKQGIIIKPRSSEDIKNAVNKISQLKNKNLKKYAQKYKWKFIINNIMEDYKNTFI